MTTILDQWKRLGALLANATGESAVIDEACSNILGYKKKVDFPIDSFAFKNGVWYGWFDGERQIPDSLGEHPWSGSIDAALAFAGKSGVRPSTLDFSVPGRVSALLRFDTTDGVDFSGGSADTAPLAILRAVCAAKIKESEDGRT